MHDSSPVSAADPLYQDALATFSSLIDEARVAGDPEPGAMTLATVGAGGDVTARVVLLKGVDARGFRFFTNFGSVKARALAVHPVAALCFHWKRPRPLQVRVEGRVERLPDAESDAYFASRPRRSQLGAWASRQSETLPDRATFDAAFAAREGEFAGEPVPRPPFWGGFLVVPDRIEFWYGEPDRLHERISFERRDAGWIRRLLYP